jgi:hypothetical protein
VTRDTLADIPAPAATATWKPIKHAVLVNAIHEEVRHRGITVVHEEYAVQRQNHMLFGVMVLNWMQTAEFAAALAFRHANDKSEAIKMYAGVRVFNPTAPLRSCRQCLSALRSSGASHTRKEPEGCYQFAAPQMMCTPFHHLK